MQLVTLHHCHGAPDPAVPNRAEVADHSSGAFLISHSLGQWLMRTWVIGPVNSKSTTPSSVFVGMSRPIASV